MAKQIKVMMLGNGPMGNRGCQAIEMSSIDLIRTAYPDAHFVIGNHNGDQDSSRNTDAALTYFKLRLDGQGDRFSRNYIGYQLHSRLGLFSNLHYLNGFYEVVGKARECDIVLSLGGDLYAQTYGTFQLFNYLALGEAARVAGKPFVVWPATLGPFDVTRRPGRFAVDRLRTYEAVLCRDEQSYDYCRQLGMSSNLRLVADPAFLLKPEAPAVIPKEFPDLHNAIGINLGPYQGTRLHIPRPEWVRLCADCVVAVWDKYKTPILLIPHVVNQINELGNCDHSFLEDVNSVLAQRGINIPSIPSDWNAKERKWLIGQLYAFVGLRTHSTIAAFGSGVPCACIGYSSKANALCKMFYGGTDLVLPVEALSPESFTKLMGRLLDSHAAAKSAIKSALPEIESRAKSSLNYFLECVSR